jgi:hypothetical protein
VSTNAGFAIGSPDALRDVCASDQIRAFRVIAINVDLFDYIEFQSKIRNKTVAVRCKRLQFF